MELESNRQIIAIQNDINILKSSLTPVFQLLQEIQDIRKKHHISQSYSISNISIISLEIKEDILKDVTSMQQLIEDKINDLGLEIKSTFVSTDSSIDKIKDEIFSMSSIAKEMNREQIMLKHSTNEAGINIKHLQREIEQRATLSNIDEMRQVIKSMTPLSSFDTLKSRVSDCVSTYQFQELQRTAEVTKQRLKKYIKTDELQDKFKEFTLNLDVDFKKKYPTMELFVENNEHIDKELKEIHQNFLTSREHVQKLDNGTNEKVRILKKAFDSKPWQVDIRSLTEIVEQKVTKVDLASFTSETIESVKTFSKEMYKVKSAVERFETVLERFDEVLLDKAEKDEIKRINGVLPHLATIESVNAVKNGMAGFTRENENKFQAQCALVEKIKMNFDYILDKFETMKKEIFDVTNLSASVAEFREAVERKADKQDIFEIYDNMCKRIDFVEANENLRMLKKQLEQATALMFALCRTLLENGEPPSQIKKQRYELLKNFNSLVNWVSGDNNVAPSHFSISKMVEGFDNDDGLDIRFPSRQSAFLRRQSAATAKNTRRMHIDFPKLA